MADDKPSLTAQIKERLATHEDLSQLTDATKKKEFLDSLESELKAPRSSLEAIFSKAIKPAATQKGLDPDIFTKKRAPRYAPGLAATAEVKPKAHQAPGAAQTGIKAQNPLVQTQPIPPLDVPLKHMAGSIDSFLGAIFDNMDELTESEKEDAGACLQMAIGQYLDTHERIRSAFGIIGLLGIYGGRIKKARKISKSKKKRRSSKPSRRPKRF